MVTLTADVTNGVKDMAENLVKKGLYKSRSEVVRDAIRQLAFKYDVKGSNKEAVRKIIAAASRKSGKTLSETVGEIRDEA